MDKIIRAMPRPSGQFRCNVSGLTVGIDLGDRKSVVCVLDDEGCILAEQSIATTPASFRQHFGSFPRSLVALEVGMHSRWTSRILKECGHDVVVANPCKVKLIYANDGKNDRVDARSLARLARADRQLLSPVQHRSEEAQAALSVLRARDAVVRARTRLINCVRGLVKPTGVRLRTASAECFPQQVREHIPEELRGATALLLEEIDSLSDSVHVYDQYIEHLAATKFPQTKLLQQVTGVGPITALGFVLTLDDPGRFRRSRQVGCYLGLRPKQNQSGESNPQLGISKGGDEFLRRLLVNAAHYILGPFGADSDLRRWGLKIAERGGQRAKKRAVAAVARKLAVLLHRLWVTAEVYEPLRNSHRSASPA
jgi:transposase